MSRGVIGGWPLALALAAAAAGSETAFPAAQWERAAPESQGVDGKKLEAAIRFLADAAGANGALRTVVVRNGRMIWRGPEADVRQGVWSVTKAFTSTAHGLLIADGKCTLDTLAKDYNPRDLAAYYPTVTLRHLATMTSGYDGVGGSYDFDEHHRGDQNAFVRPNPPFFKPGTKFMYWDEATQQYGYVLTQIAGESLQEYLKRRILDPIGITNFNWKRDATGKVLNWTGGVEISASDLARFGLLYLNRGDWNGRRLIPAEWVDEATKVQVPATIPDALPSSSRQGSGVYGYHWWPNGRRPDGKRLWPDAPAETYCRSGYNNNKLFVIPPWNMVIVRLGLDQREDPLTNAECNTFLRMVGDAILDPVVEGRRMWAPITVTFRGPHAAETDADPNPFLDYRLQLLLTSPSGRTYNVAGYFDGDGRGGGEGDVWRAKFSADEPGRWRFRASFRKGPRVAVSLDPAAGRPAAFDGQEGVFDVLPAEADAPDFHRWGRLEYVGGYYLKFRDGPYWLKGGTDSPENLLAYAGFDDTPPSHRFADHLDDWRPGDVDWGDGRGRAIVGALNYLASKHVNSIYFLVMNVGGDGQDVWPWVGPINPNGDPKNDNLHFDISKLRQWEMVFEHAQRRGLLLHVVFNEAEAPNKRELDDGELGVERKLYYREMIARFAHHPAVEWNLCEEYNLGLDLGPERVRAFADYVRAADPYDHPLAVHSAGDPLEALRFTFGDPRFSMTSIQLGQADIGETAERFREATAAAGRPLPVSLDEFTLDKGQQRTSIPQNDADRWRREKLWPGCLSGGNLEFILGGRLELDSFKTPELARLWDYMWVARRFVQSLPFWEMSPADDLVRGAASITVTGNQGKRRRQMGAQVFAKRGERYAVYFPSAARTGVIDLSDAAGPLLLRWYNPRTGRFEGGARRLPAGPDAPIGPPPKNPDDDWVALIESQRASQR